MFGMFGEDEEQEDQEDNQQDSPNPARDCTTLVEDERLQFAGDYMALVSSGMKKDHKKKVGHPDTVEKDKNEFEIFYGVQNDPNYAQFQKNHLNGLDDCPCKNKSMSGVGDGRNAITDAINDMLSNPLLQILPKSIGPWDAYKDDHGSLRWTNRNTHADISDETMYHMKYDKSLIGLGALPAENLGPNYGSWPPGPKPEPYKWTANDGTTWTLVQVDGKWMYQSSRDQRMFITTSNLYAIMGVPVHPETMIVTGEIPGEHHPDPHPHFDWSTWQIAGLGAGWVALGGLGIYMAVRAYKKRGR